MTQAMHVLQMNTANAPPIYHFWPRIHKNKQKTKQKEIKSNTKLNMYDYTELGD